jgi:hypothetical protein
MEEREYITLSNKVKLDFVLEILGDLMVFGEDSDRRAEAFDIIDDLRVKMLNEIDVNIDKYDQF